MQNKGALRLVVIALLIACAYALSFTFVARNVEKKADKYAAQYETERQEEKRQHYLDSVRTQVVYNLGLLKFNYKEVKEKEINLGLDLKGGMNVLLEISPEDIVRALSNNSQDPIFLKALGEAQKSSQGDTKSFVSHFVRAYEQNSGGSRLIDIFGTADLLKSKELSMTASNAEVETYLQNQVESAIENSYNILSKRINRFGVAQPNIQRVKNSGRILVELPGIKEPERVRKLLQGAASLEFWMTYDNSRVYPVLAEVDALLSEMEKAKSPAEKAEDAENDEYAQLSGNEEVSKEQIAQARKDNPLFARLQPRNDGSPIVGMAMSYDTAVVNSFFELEQVKAMMPNDLKLMWGVKAIDKQESIFELYAIRDRSGKGMPDMDGDAVETASGDYMEQGANAHVSMVMKTEGARQWELLTKDAISPSNLNAGFSACIAIVLDGYVYSAPVVNDVISGGRSQISGNFTIHEAKDLANVLKSGKLPAPARIKQDTVVGPSLGQESINSSMISFVIAFILVLIYVIMFYSTAGLVASVALIANLFMLFGVLVSFGAVLTLPGIAGIVLTMGMAVDANVIIYERIKEELRAGKGLSAAIAAGYKNAMSAIIDSNITSLITGVILMWFGTGPVQGFATTLIIGILTSLFCSILITRLIFSTLVESGRNVKFSTKFTENFLSKTKIDFLSIKKISYVISLSLIIISIASLGIRNLNYGVDFTGGRAYVIRFDQSVTAPQVREAMEAEFSKAEGDGAKKSFEVKQFGNENQNQMRIVTQYLTGDESADASAKVEALLYNSLNGLFKKTVSPEEFSTTATNPYGIISSDTVEASVAKGIVIDSFFAVLFGLIAIGVYIIIRFKKWQWGAGSVIALAHDGFLTIGLFSLLHGVLPFNLEIDQAFIAAILTIIGYSINDKVVIFDRIRENHVLYPKRDMKDNINSAINSTLSRTINTSGTTIVTLLAIFLFGGEVIRGFVFALMFGIIVGTLSSIFTATPLAYDLMRKSEKRQQKGK